MRDVIARCALFFCIPPPTHHVNRPTGSPQKLSRISVTPSLPASTLFLGSLASNAPIPTTGPCSRTSQPQPCPLSRAPLEAQQLFSSLPEPKSRPSDGGGRRPHLGKAGRKCDYNDCDCGEDCCTQICCHGVPWWCYQACCVTEVACQDPIPRRFVRFGFVFPQSNVSEARYVRVCRQTHLLSFCRYDSSRPPGSIRAITPGWRLLVR